MAGNCSFLDCRERSKFTFRSWIDGRGSVVGVAGASRLPLRVASWRLVRCRCARAPPLPGLRVGGRSGKNR